MLLGGSLNLNSLGLLYFDSGSCGSVELAGGSSGGSGSDSRTGAELSAVVGLGHGECRNDREHNEAAHESPCSFLKEAVCLAYAHYGACAAELRREATAFRFLNEYDADKKDGNDYGQYNYDNVHSFLVSVAVGGEFFLFDTALVYYQFLQKTQLVCKVSTFFWKFQI